MFLSINAIDIYLDNIVHIEYYDFPWNYNNHHLHTCDYDFLWMTIFVLLFLICPDMCWDLVTLMENKVMIIVIHDIILAYVLCLLVVVVVMMTVVDEHCRYLDMLPIFFVFVRTPYLYCYFPLIYLVYTFPKKKMVALVLMMKSSYMDLETFQRISFLLLLSYSCYW